MDNTEAAANILPQLKVRRDKLRELIIAARLDALLVSLAANRFYLSGFELHDPQFNESAGHLLICADGRDWLATDSRYGEAAARLWPGEYIFIYGPASAKDIAGLLARNGPRIGIEPGGASWSFARNLKKFQGRGFHIEACGGLVEKLRVKKDEWEISALKNSFALNHKMLSWLENQLAQPVDLRERDLSWAIEKFFRENGAQELAFASIVATGKNSALPHAAPGCERIGIDAPLLVDVGCRVDNYCSDQTRSYWIGEQIPPYFARTLELVKDAQKAALDIMRPGVPCSKIYAAARAVFEKAGVAEHFTHGLGHGVGLETHEAPSLSSRCETVLEKGMAVTVEPGLYYPEWGGIRWENTALVEEDGIIIL